MKRWGPCLLPFKRCSRGPISHREHGRMFWAQALRDCPLEHSFPQKLWVWNLGSFPRALQNWALNTKRKARPEKEAAHSRWAGGSSNKENDLPAGLPRPRDEKSSSPARQYIKRLYRGLSWTQPCAQSRWCQQRLTLKAASLEMAPTVGTVGGRCIIRKEEEWEASNCPDGALRSIGGHIP